MFVLVVAVHVMLLCSIDVDVSCLFLCVCVGHCMVLLLCFKSGHCVSNICVGLCVCCVVIVVI